MSMNLSQAHKIASLFELPGPLDVADFPEKGNINRQTCVVIAGPHNDRSEYILQQLNPTVFTQPQHTMEAMILCLEAQRKALAENTIRDGEAWETIRLISTRQGKPYLEIQDGSGMQCWRMMARIARARSYKSLRDISDAASRLSIAAQAGRGLAMFFALTAGLNPAAVKCSLPGYRDTGAYYDQLHSVLAGSRTVQEASAYLPDDPFVRESTQRHFLIHIPPGEYKRRLADPLTRKWIDLALEQKQFALKLARGISTGELRKVIVHGDTKLENFLFDVATLKVRALVDMDTVMPHTWLTDWGDMMRSLVNPAGEKETDPEKIRIDLDVFQAAAGGFLSSARGIAANEIDLMPDAIRTMALELGVRFLADYLRGDSYFTLGSNDPEELNKTRAIVQFRLFEELQASAGTLEGILAPLVNTRPQI